MDQETKDIVKPLVENLAYLAEKQAVILELLATKQPVSEAETKILLASAQENRTRADTWNQSLAAWKK